MRFLAALCATALLPAVSAQVASQEVTVSVTLPVKVPLTVRPGETFQQAADAFCVRNAIGPEYAADLTAALGARWSTMQDENRANRCMQWQREYSVVPLQTWGSLPVELRKQWLDLDCDAVVPATAPVPLASLPVRVLDQIVNLDVYEGDDLGAAVLAFCRANSVDHEANGALLRNALHGQLYPEAAARQVAAAAAAAAAAADAAAAAAVEAAAAAAQQQRSFLFSVPVQIDGAVQNLEVHEGDDLIPLVAAFCQRHGIDEAAHGEVLRNMVVSTLDEKRIALLEQAEKDQAEREAAERASNPEPILMFSLPVSLDGGVTVDLDVYDGDLLSEAVGRFCEANGISLETHGEALSNAAMDKYRATQQAQNAAASVAEA